MEYIGNCLVTKIINKLVKDKAISINELDLYQFGVEVTLLKILHFISYFVIAVLMDRIVEFVIIFTTFYLFRRNVGGFHAKTRIGCYIFSCTVIIISLTIVGTEMNFWLMNTVIVCDSLLLLIIAPIQNQNRGLNEEDTIYFRYRLLWTLSAFVVFYIGAVRLANSELVELLVIGITLATSLAILGKIQLIIEQRRKK